MKKYIIRRLLLIIPVMIGVSIVIFALIHMAPGDPYSSMIDPTVTEEDKENMLRSIGYYDPIPVQYVKWVGRALHGDLGYSIRYKEPCINVIKRRFGNTVMLALSALVVSSVVGIILGIIAATKKNSLFDYFVSAIAFVGLSIPAFFLGLLMVKFLAFNFKLFPISGMETIASGYEGMEKFVDIFHHMVLPLTTLSLVNIAEKMRYTRSAMLEVIQQDYIRTAKAKGVKKKVIIYQHALKNALIPVVTVVSMSLGKLLSGTILTETVFVWPGMGTLVYQSILNRDYPLVVSSTMLLAFLMLISNLIADILYAVLDPRIKYN